MQNNYDDFLDRVYARDGKLRPGPAQPPARSPQPMMTPAQIRAQRRQYATPINRRPPKYEPAPHWFNVVSTACLFFAGVFVVMFVLVVILHMQVFVR